MNFLSYISRARAREMAHAAHAQAIMLIECVICLPLIRYILNLRIQCTVLEPKKLQCAERSHLHQLATVSIAFGHTSLEI